MFKFLYHNTLNFIKNESTFNIFLYIFCIIITIFSILRLCTYNLITFQNLITFLFAGTVSFLFYFFIIENIKYSENKSIRILQKFFVFVISYLFLFIVNTSFDMIMIMNILSEIH